MSLRPAIHSTHLFRYELLLETFPRARLRLKMASNIPVVIGVGDVKNRSSRLEDALEPLELMLQAISVALEDTGASDDTKSTIQKNIDSISVVANWTWPYPNTPELLAKRLECQAKHLHESEHGGNAPAELFDEAARRISTGASKVAIVSGGEALVSCAITPYSSGQLIQ